VAAYRVRGVLSALLLLVVVGGLAHAGVSPCPHDHGPRGVASQDAAVLAVDGFDLEREVSAPGRASCGAREHGAPAAGHEASPGCCMAACSPVIAAAEPIVGPSSGPSAPRCLFSAPFVPATLSEGPLRPPRG
jgi:hypothetical protein